MGIVQLIQLVATLAGAAKDISDVATAMHAQGLTVVPPEHMAKVQAALDSVPDAAWDENHANTG